MHRLFSLIYYANNIFLRQKSFYILAFVIMFNYCMKKIFFFFVVILLLSSCNDDKNHDIYSPYFFEIRSLMTSDPREALNKIMEIDESEDSLRFKDPYFKNEFNILYAEASFKSSRKQPNKAEVAEATAFYDSLFNIYENDLNVSFQTARAHYYKAVGETEVDNIVESCEDYLTSLKIMKHKFKRKNLDYEKNRFIALIYTRLGTLYSDEYYFDIALDYYHNSYLFFKYINDTTSYLYSSARIGKSYQSINEIENAKFWYKNTISEASEKNHVYSDYAKRGLAQICFDGGETDTSVNIIKELINMSDDNDKYAYEYTMAEMYLDLCQYDSALFYAKESFLHGNKSTKLISANMIYEIYKSLAEADMDESDFMNNKKHPANRDNTDIKIQIASLYDEYKSDEDKNARYLTAIVSIVIALLVITFSFIRTMNVTKKSHQETLDKKDEIIKNNEWRISLIEGKIRSSNEELRQKEEIIKKQKSEIDDIKSRINSGNSADLEKYYNSDICIEVIRRVQELNNKNLKATELEPLSNNELILVLQSANLYLDNYINRLGNKYPDLKKDDLYCICLLLLNIDKSYLQYFLGKNQSSIWRRLDKIRKIMNIDINESFTINFIKEI